MTGILRRGFLPFQDDESIAEFLFCATGKVKKNKKAQRVLSELFNAILQQSARLQAGCCNLNCKKPAEKICWLVFVCLAACCF